MVKFIEKVFLEDFLIQEDFISVGFIFIKFEDLLVDRYGMFNIFFEFSKGINILGVILMEINYYNVF